ncbi:MAG: N-Acetylneuraminate cytidylyltransferase [Planctomycetaceae bacterium]|nr:N-Acetylneuraminate cytidylyltransferase [Planctomycetaceae bacterium]
MRIAVIPARGGSKRIPRKNIKAFCGKPMIAWPIEAAKASGLFEHVVVSTDDAEIAEVARNFGAEVPFMRPATLSDDYTGTSPVIAHAIERCKEAGWVADTVCCIYATAPLLAVTDLLRGLTALDETGAEFAFSVTSYAFPVQRAIKLSKDGRVEMFQPAYFHTRSQDLDEAFHDAGQFYWGRASAWLEQLPLFADHSTAVQIPRFRVQDIDTSEDWERAEYLARAIRLEQEVLDRQGTPQQGAAK